MNSRAQMILEEFSVGDRVQAIFVLNGKQFAPKGTIKYWDDKRLVLSDPTAVILLDDSFITLISVDEPEPKTSVVSDSMIQRQFVPIPSAQPFQYQFDNSAIEKLKRAAKEMSEPELRQTYGGILDSIREAYKNKALSFKYHTIRSNILQTWDKCAIAEDFYSFYLFLGMVAIGAEDYNYAMEPLVRAKEYRIAAFAAYKASNSEMQDVLYICALLNYEVTVDQYVLSICKKEKTVVPLSVLLELHKQENNSEVCALVAAALSELCQSVQIRDVVITPMDTDVIAAEKMLRALPSEWKKDGIISNKWIEFSSYTYPVIQMEESGSGLIGNIRSFDKNRGRIAVGDKLYSFLVSQVYDENDTDQLLRHLLKNDRYHDLEVFFDLGLAGNGTVAATNIELTDEGIKEAEKRVVSPYREGYIKHFWIEKEQGYITEEGFPDRSFYLSAVTDPYLRHVLKTNWSEANYQTVSFRPESLLSGKIIAVDIISEEPAQFHKPFLPEREAEAFKKYQKSRVDEARNALDLSEKDPYPEYPFSELPLYQSNQREKTVRPLTWQTKGIVSTPAKGGTVIGQNNSNANPQTEPVPQKMVKTKIDSATSVSFIRDEGRRLMEIGRRERDFGNAQKAEDSFKAALASGYPTESVVSELITLYQKIQTPEKLEEGAKLLKQYETEIEPTKLLNLKISLYDQMKDYEKLIPLYEQAFQEARTVARKSHQLYRMASAYISLGQYENAVKTCDRWQRFFNQNRYDPDFAKIRNAENGMKRRKAIALYHIGDLEEARKIATDLVRINPADAAANAILEGTLQENPVFTEENTETDPHGEVEDTEPSHISRFVRAKIEAADVNSILKESFKDGKYTGTVKKAQNDVKQLTDSSTIELRGGNTAKTRSDRLFAACRIIESMQTSEVQPWPTGTEERLAGRAMAAWGDYMISQTSQLDTSRMAYLFAISMLPAKLKGGEQNWSDAYNRYLRSFLVAKNDLEQYIADQNATSKKDGLNLDVLDNANVPDVLMPEFLVGILNLLDALSQQREPRDRFIQALHSKNPSLRDRLIILINQTYDYSEGREGTGPTITELEEKLTRACESLKNTHRQLDVELRSISSFLMRSEVSAGVLDGVSEYTWQRYLTATDSARLQKIHSFFVRAQDYFVNTDFESRAECLRTLIFGVEELQKDIQAAPTTLSYDIFLPKLQEMSTIFMEKQDRLYADYSPKISWVPMPDASVTAEKTVYVQLLVKNEINHQSADSLQVVGSEAGPDINSIREAAHINTLRGNDSQIFILNLDVKERALESGSFTINLCYSYRYNDSPLTLRTETKQEVITVVLPSETVINYSNPYKQYIGNEMTDTSMFYGRDDIINDLVRMVYSSETGKMKWGHATAIYGQTRCGKSSIFYHLKNKLEREHGDHILVWNVGNIGSILSDSSSQYVAKFLNRMLVRGKMAFRKAPRLVERLRESGLEMPIKEIREHPEMAEDYFDDYMQELDALLEQENYIIVLLIDEFTGLLDGIRSGKIPNQFMDMWKGLLESYRLFTFVIGQDNMQEFMELFPNQFARMEVREITYLDKAPAKQLIREPLEHATGRIVFDDIAVETLYEQTGGSAFLTLILCSAMVEYLNSKQVMKVNKWIVQDFMDRWLFNRTETYLTGKDFEPQMRERGHSEFTIDYENILYAVAKNSQTTGWAPKESIQNDALEVQNLNMLIQRLVDRHILLQDGNQYKIVVGLLEKWLLKTRGV